MKSIYVMLFFFSINFSVTAGSAEGELAGKLGFGALVLDAYYELCYSGVRVDNYLNGVNKLLQGKWGVDYTEISIKLEKESGRNFRQEAYTLINYKIREFQSCNSVRMNEWLKYVEKTQSNNLKTLHSIR